MSSKVVIQICALIHLERNNMSEICYTNIRFQKWNKWWPELLSKNWSFKGWKHTHIYVDLKISNTVKMDRHFLTYLLVLSQRSNKLLLNFYLFMFYIYFEIKIYLKLLCCTLYNLFIKIDFGIFPLVTFSYTWWIPFIIIQ